MEIIRPYALFCIVITGTLCGCSCRNTENSDTASTMTNAAIRIHGDFRIVTGAYDITVSANGHIAYSNYPLSVKRSELGPAEVTNILSEMHKVGFWKLDAQALSNAVSEVVVQDATRITLMATWQGEERAITFERDRMLSPVVGKSGAIESLRHCVDLVEKRVLAARLP